MTTFNLVVQSPALASDLIEQAAALSEASGVQRLSTTAARLLQVNASPAARAELLAWGESRSVDTAFIATGSRLADCKILAMDMDSTLINIECIDEIAAFGGVKEQVASITEAAMRGEIKSLGADGQSSRGKSGTNQRIIPTGGAKFGDVVRGQSLIRCGQYGQPDEFTVLMR